MGIKNGIVLRVCRGHACGHASNALEQAIRSGIEDKGLQEWVGIAFEACYGRCFMGPNILVERWRDGHRNEKALMALMVNVDHPDLQFACGVTVEDIPRLIAHYLKGWAADTGTTLP